MHTMATERARSRLESLAAAGLDVATFGTAALDLLVQAMPFTAACLAPVDPATELITNTVKWGGLTNDQDDEWAFWEYEANDKWDFRTTVHRPGGVTSTHVETGGYPELSPRQVEFFQRTYDFGDEMRAALRTDNVTWGFLALFRDGAGSTFTPAEQAFVSTITPLFGRGFRAALVAGATSTMETGEGPAVIVIDQAGQVVQASIGAAARVAELGGGPLGQSQLPMGLRNLVGSARTYAAERHTQVPRMRMRTQSGGWVVAHASPLLSALDSSVNIVVTIEEARPPEVIPLIVAAYGLTAREQAVVQYVLQGVNTAEIAAALHLSAYTVQDHLKSIFEKAGVRSRRELTARVFFDQYAPRMTSDSTLGPSGWFAANLG